MTNIHRFVTHALMVLSFLFLAPACAKEKEESSLLTSEEADYAHTVIRAIENNDVAWLGSNLTYPICLTTSNANLKRAASQGDFADLAPGLLSKSFRQSVSHGKSKVPIKNWRGVGLAGGLVWFDDVAGGHQILRMNAPGVVDCDGYSGVGE